MKNILCFILFFTVLQFRAQELKIIAVKEYAVNNFKHFIITCELKNNSKTAQIVLPIPLVPKGDDNQNDYNYFYSVETNPKEAIVIEERPPGIQTQIEKLTAKNIVVCQPKTSVQFEIDTQCFMDYANYFDDRITIKQIRLIYQPLSSEVFDKSDHLSEELLTTDFYAQKIRSNAFSIKE